MHCLPIQKPWTDRYRNPSISWRPVRKKKIRLRKLRKDLNFMQIERGTLEEWSEDVRTWHDNMEKQRKVFGIDLMNLGELGNKLEIQRKQQEILKEMLKERENKLETQRKGLDEREESLKKKQKKNIQ